MSNGSGDTPQLESLFDSIVYERQGFNELGNTP
jgi:hypothetical protein